MFWSESSCRLVTISFNLSNKVFLFGVYKMAMQENVRCWLILGTANKLWVYVQPRILWLYLSSFKWLNPSLHLVRIFITIELWISDTELRAGLNCEQVFFWKLCKKKYEFGYLNYSIQ